MTMAASDRSFVVAGAQLGPVHVSSSRSDTMQRMLKLMDEAHSQQAKLIVYPEIAPVTFFPRHLLEGDDLEHYFEDEEAVGGDPTRLPNLKALFDRARQHQIDVYIGYAEHASRNENQQHVHFNTSVYYSAAEDRVVARYRKVHLPGTVEPYEDKDATNQLEKRYFRPGDLGFKAFRVPGLISNTINKSAGAKANDNGVVGKGDPILGMLICNDRRWPEAWRSYSLQGCELVLCGYNTTAWAPDLIGNDPKLTTREQSKEEALFHNKLSLTYNSYANACFSINVAKCGLEDGKYPLIGGSCIVDPDGHIVAEAKTEDDELVVARIDLEQCRRGKDKMFAFEKHRRPEHYGIIVEQTGVVEPELL